MRMIVDESGNDSVTAALPAPAEKKVDTSDCGLALWSATRIEQKLGEILQEYLLCSRTADQLVEGMLPSLSARALACHSLALIDDHEYADCDAISRISAEFHRSPFACFESDHVTAICRKLHFRDKSSSRTPREQFASAVAALLRRLGSRAVYIGHEKRTSRKWEL